MNTHQFVKPEGIEAILKGYGRKDPNGLASIADYCGWRGLAAVECARRAAEILELLSLPELDAVVAGRIDLAAIATTTLVEPSAEFK